MRNTIRTTIALMMMIGGLSFTAQAQDDGVDHCKFARELCIRLGIPTSTTASGDALFALLLKEVIYPKEGWECDKVLTVGDFARSREFYSKLLPFLGLQPVMDAAIVHPPEEGAWAPGYYSVLFEDPDGIRLEMNFVPGKGLLESRA